jgi:hypothetical protein
MLGNEAGFEEIEQQLKNGENVVLLANHQTEVRRRLRSALRLCSADRTVC